MSVTSKRRYVTQKLDESFVLPDENQLIGLVIATRGNNLHEVEDQSGHTYLVSMPSKFRKSVWIKRGQFVLMQRIEEGDKVQAEISHVLDRDNVLYIREQKRWPERFECHAERMTRSVKHDQHQDVGTERHPMIDADMLPPSESESEEDEDEDDSSKQENKDASDSNEESLDHEVEDNAIIVQRINEMKILLHRARSLFDVCHLRFFASSTSLSNANANANYTSGIEHAVKAKEIGKKHKQDPTDYKASAYLHFNTLSFYDKEMEMVDFRVEQPSYRKRDEEPKVKQKMNQQQEEKKRNDEKKKN